MEKRKIPISIPVMGDEELEALKDPIQSGWLTSGPKVREFENEFAKIHNVNMLSQSPVPQQLCIWH